MRKAPPFETRYTVDHDTGCWLWQDQLSAYGYGVLTICHRTKMAHRVSWEIARGPIPEGLHIDHLCRVKACVNPDHLEPVTSAENSRRGVKVKLTMESAREIRAEVARGADHQTLADRFGVARSTISGLVTDRTWREESEAA